MVNKKNKIYRWFLPHEGNNYKPHSLRHKNLAIYSGILILVKLLVVFLLFVSYPSPAEFSTITVNRIVELTNNERLAAGLGLLNHSAILDLAAEKKAKDMIQNSYFAHTSPAGVKPWFWFNEVKYNYTYAGENLAMNFVEAEDALEAWMNSPSHRENILSKNFEDIGIGVAIGKINGFETTVVVQMFGKTYAKVAGESFKSESEEITGKEQQNTKEAFENETIKQEVKAVQEEVKLETTNNNGWLAQVIYFSEKFFIVFLAFILINLLLNILVRIEVQHKPIILHSLFVVLLALIMIFMKFHFIEQIGHNLNII